MAARGDGGPRAVPGYLGGTLGSIDLSNLTVVGLYTRNGFVATVRFMDFLLLSDSWICYY